MKINQDTLTHIIQISKKENYLRRSIPVRSYKEAFLQFPKLKSLKFTSPNKLSFSSTTGNLIDRLYGLLESKLAKPKSKKKPLLIKSEGSILLLEVLYSSIEIDECDQINSAIYHILKKTQTERPLLICISLLESELYKRAVGFKLLKEECEKQSIPLILLNVRENQIIGEIIGTNYLGLIGPFKTIDTELSILSDASPLETAEISKGFKIIYGHFEIMQSAKAFHVTALGSIKEFIKDPKKKQGLLEKLRREVLPYFKNDKFVLYPFYMVEGSGINQLMLEFANVGYAAIRDPFLMKPENVENALFLCDFLSDVHPIQEKIDEAKKNGIKNIVIIGFGKYADFETKDNVTATVSYGDCNLGRQYNLQKECHVCKHSEGEFILGSTYESCESQITNFDPYLFWELLSVSESYYDVNHWISPSTGYHYFFRALCKEIFKEHADHLATRFYNKYTQNRGSKYLIKKVVCPDEASAIMLAESVAEKFGLENRDVIRISRKEVLDKMIGEKIPESVDPSSKKNRIKHLLKEQPVVIVDQAAHHYTTLSKLKTICDKNKSGVSATFVFIDRTPDAHDHQPLFISLYKWPIQPLQPNHCPCDKYEGK